MNFEIKQTILSALLTLESQIPKETETENSFLIWLDYARNVLSITSKHVNQEIVSKSYCSIKEILSNNSISNFKKIIFCHEVLTELCRYILKLENFNDTI